MRSSGWMCSCNLIAFQGFNCKRTQVLHLLSHQIIYISEPCSRMRSSEEWARERGCQLLPWNQASGAGASLLRQWDIHGGPTWEAVGFYWSRTRLFLMSKPGLFSSFRWRCTTRWLQSSCPAPERPEISKVACPQPASSATNSHSAKTTSHSLSSIFQQLA